MSLPSGGQRRLRRVCRCRSCCGGRWRGTRTWTAAAAEVERERTRELARIGSNLNQIARWANTHKTEAEAVQILAHLVAIERELGALAVRGDRHDG